MRSGFYAPTLAYVPSQFFGAFFAVLAPVFQTNIGADTNDLALGTGVWLAALAVSAGGGRGADHAGDRRLRG